MSNLLLSLDNVTAGYAKDIDVLRGISLQVESGKISGLIGLNGAGKSTIVKTICGFLTPKEGQVQFLGKSTEGVPPHLLVGQGLACIPQESSLFPYLTVEENLTLPLRVQGQLDASALRERTDEMYSAFPILEQKRRSQAGDLSGGQQKQLEFAKVWAQRPRLCIIDEPSIGLSPNVAEEIFVWIERFREANMGVLLIDHNVRRVVSMSDEISVLSLGTIAVTGKSEEFQGDLHQQVRQWLGLNY